jgi:predicted lipoprotein with Yx(FWY)xxD motif
MKKLWVALTWGIVASGALAAPAVERNGVLADAKGMTLYVFTKDTPNVSTCYDGCAKAWPPFAVLDASKANAEFTVVARKDGSKQWAHKGRPLYYYAGDDKPGDATGEGSGGVWFVVKGSKAVKAAPAPTSQGSGGY